MRTGTDMKKQKFLSAIAAGVILASSGAAQAPVPSVPAPVEAEAAAVSFAPVTRVITLDELGFDNGFEIEGLSGGRTLYFPVPAGVGVDDLRLTLPYRADSSFGSRRSIAIEIGGRTQYTAALPEGLSEGVIDIPVDPALAQDGFLATRIVYSGAITEDRCVDQRLSGAYLAFAGEGGLRARLQGPSLGRVSTVASVMPAALDLSLPSQASEAQLAAALTLMLGGSDSRLGGARTDDAATQDGWRIGRIGFADASAPALSVGNEGGAPSIRIGGEDPVASARLFRSRWNSIAASSSLATARRGSADGERETLTIADLGADSSAQSIADRGQWNVAIPATAIPAGKRITGLTLDVAVAEDGGEARPVIAVLFNGVLLASAEAEEDGRTQIVVDLPEGLANTLNNLEVSVMRQAAGGDCKYVPQGYPAQLLPSSRIELGEAGSPQDFSDLPSVLNGGFTVVMPDAASLAPVAALLNPLASGEGPVGVSFDGMPANGAVVYVGADAPAGSEPKVQFTQGAIEISGENGETILDRDAIDALTTVQLLEQNGRSVLWIRPGSDFATLGSSASPPALGYGNVAFLAGDQVDFAFHDERERLIDIRYPEENTISKFLQRYRLWLIGLGWLLVTLGFVYLLRRVIASNKSKD